LIVGFFVLDETTTSIPTLFLFVLVLHRAMPQVQSLGQVAASLATTLGQLGLVGELMRNDNKEFIRSGGLTISEIKRQIEIHNLSFVHSGETKPTLQDINFVLNHGATVGVVGSSGAGKSTLADLVLGLRQPTTGRILIDGVDLSELDQEKWLRIVGVVDQDIFLLNDTIKRNIAFASEGLSQDSIISVAKLANAHHFIEAFPKGYDTIIGDRGIRLSGGQKQRLAMARALARNPQLLILDEATSALDSESERLIQKTVTALKGSRTILVVAHRLSTVMAADEIIVLDSGEIVEHGPPGDLIDRGGIFSRAWNIQTQTE
jgi:subfamily B ATP-binding cassette protein MsbA